MAPTEPMTVLDADKANALCREIFTRAGAQAEHAAAVAENLILADLRGTESHGISRAFVYCERLRHGLINPTPNIRVVKQQGGAMVLDADNALGAVAGNAAMDLCMEKARETGVAVCAVAGGNHFGIAAYYAMRALPHDMIGMAFTNAPPTMAPWGSITPQMGTNPICYAIPAGECLPIVFDAASSVVARGKINLAEIEGRPIPDYWAMDEAGKPTTDATAALKGSVLPFGTYKGSGIAILVDIFCALLSGAAFGSHVGNLYANSAIPQNLGFLLCALDIAAFQEARSFKTRMDQMIRELKGGQKAHGVEEILMPGEPEFHSETARKQNGIPVGPGVMADLRTLCRRYAMDTGPDQCIR